MSPRFTTDVLVFDDYGTCAMALSMVFMECEGSSIVLLFAGLHH